MTDLYAVIGNPIGHSRSPAIHAAFAAQTGQAMEYVALEAPEGGFAAAADAFRARGGRGLNVTAPFKLDAFRYATATDPAAGLAGAVNCLAFDGAVATGRNYDGAGLLRDIQDNLGLRLAGRCVLVLGAGGAARGALPALLAAEVSALALVNRTPARAEALAAAFAAHGPIVAGLDGARPFDLVLNTASPDADGAGPSLADATLSPGALAYDVVYGRGMTPFLRAAAAAGAGRLADGVGMLVEQAADAFALWRGVRPHTRPVIAQIGVPLR